MRFAALALLVSGCLGGSALVEGFEEDLQERGGCADLYAFAANDDDTLLLEVTLAGPIKDADGAISDQTLSLPDPTATVTVALGHRLSDASCTDLIVNGGPKVRQTWNAIEGTVDVQITPEGEAGEPATADLSLHDLILESPHGDQVPLSDFSWTELSVGWFAG